MQNSEPKYLQTTEGISGLCGDIYIELKQRMESKGIGVDIPREFYPIKRILLMLEKGESDVYCGAGRNPQREPLYVYSEAPIYSVSNVIAAHQQDTLDPLSLEELAQNKSLVGVLQGTSSASYLKQQPGIAIDDSFHDLNKALALVARKQFLRYFYYHDLGLNYLVPKSGLPLRVVPTKFRSTPQWIIYSKKTPENLRMLLDQEVSAMVASGEMANIAERYLQSR